MFPLTALFLCPCCYLLVLSLCTLSVHFYCLLSLFSWISSVCVLMVICYHQSPLSVLHCYLFQSSLCNFCFCVNCVVALFSFCRFDVSITILYLLLYVLYLHVLFIFFFVPVCVISFSVSAICVISVLYVLNLCHQYSLCPQSVL